MNNLQAIAQPRIPVSKDRQQSKKRSKKKRELKLVMRPSKRLRTRRRRSTRRASTPTGRFREDSLSLRGAKRRGNLVGRLPRFARNDEL